MIDVLDATNPEVLVPIGVVRIDPAEKRYVYWPSLAESRAVPADAIAGLVFLAGAPTVVQARKWCRASGQDADSFIEGVVANGYALRLTPGNPEQLCSALADLHLVPLLPCGVLSVEHPVPTVAHLRGVSTIHAETALLVWNNTESRSFAEALERLIEESQRDRDSVIRTVLDDLAELIGTGAVGWVQAADG